MDLLVAIERHDPRQRRRARLVPPDAPDRVRFEAKLPKGGQNYRVRRFKWTGRPRHRPRLASHPARAHAAVALQRQAVVRAGGDRDHAARGACGDGALAEHLGHTDLSTVARYGHADRDELVDATGRLEQLAAPREESEAPAAERPGAGDSLVAADACRASERLSAIQIRVPTCRNAEIGSFSIARSRNSHDAAEQRAALSASQASRSCSLAGAARGATTTVPSNTSGPRNAFISLSWERWRSICASMRTTAAYSAGSAGGSPRSPGLWGPPGGHPKTGV